MTKIDAIFARNLVSIRRAKGFRSAESLAEALGYSLRTVQRYEAGERMPDSEKIEHIAEKLGVQSQDFFKTGEAMVIERAEPVSNILKKLLTIPDEVYDLAHKVPKDDKETWEAVIWALERGANKAEKEGKTKGA